MKIICIGRNYIEHAHELNNPVPENPVFFLKPDSSLLKSNKPFFYPKFSADIQYELEFVLRIVKVGKSVPERFASRYYDAVAIGIDFTARDMQNDCKKNGLPWEISKAFDNSAVLSRFIDKNTLLLDNLNMHLDINGTTVQQANSKQMIFSFNKIIAWVSRFMTLKTGDFIYTGTPAGVGPVKIGDHLEGYLEDNKLLDFYVR